MRWRFLTEDAVEDVLKDLQSGHIPGYPDWLRRIYQIRFEAENINYSKHYKIIHEEGTK